MKPNAKIVLLHGLGGSRLDMVPLAFRLKRLDYQVENWGYSSLGARIEDLSERVSDRLVGLQSTLGTDDAIHIVTHSMGGIIVRAALQRRHYPAVHRIVMLAPPHQGSHTARKLSPYLRWLAPSLQQLSDAPDSYVNALTNSFVRRGVEFGIIEAERDRVISKGAVRIDGYRDFATVDGHHGILTWYPVTWQLVERFLRFGSFAQVAGHDWKCRAHDQCIDHDTPKGF